MAILISPPTFIQKLALAWLALVVLVAALAAALPLPYRPGVPDLAHITLAPFGPGQHWLGTDPQGRDVLSVLVFGTRTALLLTVPAAVLAALVGAVAGGAAGFWGNSIRLALPYWLGGAGLAWWGLRLPGPWLGTAAAGSAAVLALLAARRRWALPTWSLPLNTLVLGAATLLDTIPRLVLVVALAAGVGVSAGSLLVLLTLTTWPYPARLVRAQMLRVRAMPYVEAARAVGMPAFRVWWRHALPHALQPLRTAFPLSVAGLLGLESTLSFLGIGLPPDVASWGRLLASGRNEPQAWWLIAFPGIMLVITILSLSVFARNAPKSPAAP